MPFYQIFVRYPEGVSDSLQIEASSLSDAFARARAALPGTEVTVGDSSFQPFTNPIITPSGVVSPPATPPAASQPPPVGDSSGGGGQPQRSPLLPPLPQGFVEGRDIGTGESGTVAPKAPVQSAAELQAILAAIGRDRPPPASETFPELGGFFTGQPRRPPAQPGGTGSFTPADIDAIIRVLGGLGGFGRPPAPTQPRPPAQPLTPLPSLGSGGFNIGGTTFPFDQAVIDILGGTADAPVQRGLNPALDALLRLFEINQGSQLGQDQLAAQERISAVDSASQLAVAQLTGLSNEAVARLYADAQETVAAANNISAAEVARIAAGGDLGIAQAQGRTAIDVEKIRGDYNQALASFTGQSNEAIAKIQSDAQVQAARAPFGPEAQALQVLQNQGQLGVAQAQANPFGITAQQFLTTQAGPERIAGIQVQAQRDIAAQTGLTEREIAQIQAGNALAVQQARGLSDQQIAQIGAAAQQRVSELQAQTQRDVAQTQANPFGLSREQFLGLQGELARGGFTPQERIGQLQAQFNPFGFSTQQALEAERIRSNPFGQSAQDIFNLQTGVARGGLSPQERIGEIFATQNPFGFNQGQFAGLQESLARGGLSPQQRVQEIISAQNPFGFTGDQFSNLQLGVARGGLSPQQRVDEILATQNPFGFSGGQFSDLQTAVARGGLSPAERLAEIEAANAPRFAETALGFLSNPSAVGSIVGFGGGQALVDLAGTPFGRANETAQGPTPTLNTLRDFSDEETGFLLGRQAARGVTPSRFRRRVQSVTPFGR